MRINAAIAHLLGDYVVQSEWVAVEKTKRHPPALLHGAAYAACFLPLTRNPQALLVIGGTHAVIDRYRLAKYVVWARNQLAPSSYRYALDEMGGFGEAPNSPAWLAGWLLFIADNTMHLLINEWALDHWEDR